MGFTIGTLVLVSFLVSLAALAVLIWAIARNQMSFDENDARTIFAAEDARGTGIDDPSVSPEKASQASDLTGEPIVSPFARMLLLAIFSAGTLYMLAGSAFGLVASMKLHLPDWLDGAAPLTFGRMRAVHLNLVAYGWLSLVGIGMALWLVPTILGTHLRLAGLAALGAALWTIGVALGAVAIDIGWTDGLEWLEIPWQIDILLAAGGACLAIPLLVTARHRQVHHIYVTGWYYIGALIWFPTLFLVANIPGLHVGAQQATVNWWFAHNVLGLWLTPLGVGAAYYFIPRIIGKPIYSYRLSLLGFWALALFYSQVGMHHLIGGPVPTWVVTLSVVQSVMMFVPVIAVAINQHTLSLGNLDVVRASIPLRFVALGALLYTAASFQGSLEAVRSVNTVTHFTHYTVAHAHLGAYGFVSLVMFGGLYYVIPRLVERVWPLPSLMVWHFWLVAIGFAIYFLSLTIGGWLQGLAMLDASRDWMESMELTIPYLQGRSVGGALMTLGHVLFAVNLGAILIGYGAARAPAADTLAPAE
ncbi:cytochrome c oxidase cbb3-type subunit 1 [Palleronia aestuarii]|uniref:Cytochrome c oxidase cbb3-type subunit 1 n=1 Tax=Palleronia aestuarii TaxID=568105 RepID=A0A2W7N7F2_9RHOB|nr:cbb3-type cytochrome c oxidase subunit I [Palleronia aestuarii]PZX12804.1 cytochrome c oxidase cbb3-type subunit 1 [Palleronia aestuarii]